MNPNMKERKSAVTRLISCEQQWVNKYSNHQMAKWLLSRLIQDCRLNKSIYCQWTLVRAFVEGEVDGNRLLRNWFQTTRTLHVPGADSALSGGLKNVPKCSGLLYHAFSRIAGLLHHLHKFHQQQKKVDWISHRMVYLVFWISTCKFHFLGL